MSTTRLDRFRAHPDPSGRGRSAEDDAVAWLERRGYRPIERNARTATGEIDLVAEEDGTLCFVEIKARATAEFGPAVAAVGASKQRRLRRAAALWLATNPTDAPCRFDVLGLDAADDGWEFTLVRDAFQG
jgi:putative endonuclease